jgi:hypothetical protein
MQETFINRKCHPCLGVYFLLDGTKDPVYVRSLQKLIFFPTPIFENTLHYYQNKDVNICVGPNSQTMGLIFQIFQIKDERLPSHSVCTAGQSLGWKLQTL